jgi:catechol 2,3-dioxygenase-like lactoylglutathione lyase family enzyme
MSALIQATIPMLASLNLDESSAFYADYLGFETRRRFDDYMVVSREGCQLHFWLSLDKHLAENTSCLIRCSDAQALYDEFQQRGLQLDLPTVRPWGMKELYVIDPHGNLLKFGEPV